TNTRNNNIQICSMDTYRIEETAEYIRSNYVTAKYYYSSDEIWYAGTAKQDKSWLLRTNENGDVSGQWLLDGAFLNQFISGIARTETTLLLGLIDNVTIRGSVAIYKNETISFVDLGDAQIYNYSNTLNGGLAAQGLIFSNDGNSCAPITMIIDNQGDIVFSATGESYITATSAPYLTKSMSCASDNAIYILEVSGAETADLSCMDVYGNELWHVKVDDNISVHSMMLSDAKIYLFGYRREYGKDYGVETHTPIKTAIIQCFSQKGEVIWERAERQLTDFFAGDAADNICAASGKDESGKWYTYIFSDKGLNLRAVQQSKENEYGLKPILCPDQRVTVLGTSADFIMISRFQY
ncbi:MAG: hypothetical protein RR975_12975, partial [Clostridia bacterium]